VRSGLRTADAARALDLLEPLLLRAANTLLPKDVRGRHGPRRRGAHRCAGGARGVCVLPRGAGRRAHGRLRGRAAPAAGGGCRVPRRHGRGALSCSLSPLSVCADGAQAGHGLAALLDEDEPALVEAALRALLPAVPALAPAVVRCATPPVLRRV
jgi:hypothetical protein